MRAILSDPYVYAGIAFCVSLILIAVVVCIFERPRTPKNRRIYRSVNRKALPAPSRECIAGRTGSFFVQKWDASTGRSYRGMQS